MKTTTFWQRDWVWAVGITLVIALGTRWLPTQQANNYFEVTINNLVQTGSVFLRDYPSYFNELVPTDKGPVMVMPPFPLVPVALGLLMNLGEFRVTQLGIGICAGLMYLIMRWYRLQRGRAILVTSLYLLTTPLLFFLVRPGYWFSAQVWGVVGGEIALLGLLHKKYAWAGIGTAVAILSRLNLGLLTALGMAWYLCRKARLKDVIQYAIPVALGGAMMLGWNYLRFGSIWTIGYNLIPGILGEPWYFRGIMHYSYIWENLKRFGWQWDTSGEGIGIIWAQPYLLLLPWLINKQNRWLIWLGLAQFGFVLTHGWWGAYQFDFRFLMDSLWVLFPAIALVPTNWRWWVVWTMLGMSATVHLVLIGRFL